MTNFEKFRLFFSARLNTLAPEDELLWLSSDVPVDALRAAYPLGVFPWPGDHPDLFPWVSPARRGVLPLARFHLGKSTRRQLRKAAFRVTFDQAFSGVIRTCAEQHAPDTWIHPKMIQAYEQAHAQGFAHSVEVWEDRELVGGLYGIDSGCMFSGESMFHKRPNAGKAAISALVDRLRERENVFLDIQQLTPHMHAMGALEVDRTHFLHLLRQVRARTPGKAEEIWRS